MHLRSETFRKWWPATQSLDLVQGTVETVAAAVEAELRRFPGNEEMAASWQSFPCIDAAFEATAEFTNTPTFFLVLPTRSRWSVLWNNRSLCDGYDSDLALDSRIP